MKQKVQQWRKFSYRMRRDYLTAENIVLGVALILCLSWAWASITAMSRNWELEQSLQEKQLDKAKIALQVEKLKLEQEYYLTDEYKELTARAKLGKMQDGEFLLILPENSKTAKEKYKQADTNQIVQKTNFEEWLEFLFS